MTPEYPDWKPWWIRYAEFDGVRIAVCDRNLTGVHDACWIWASPSPRYSVGVLTDTVLNWCRCDSRVTALDSSRSRWHGDSLDEALAAFYEAERELIGAPA